jgi:hypothetical protein
MFGNNIETRIFTVAASLCRGVRRVGPVRRHSAVTTTSATGHGDISLTVLARALDEALLLVQA